MRYLLAIILSICSIIVHAQSEYDYADSIALSHAGKKFKNTGELAQTLTHGVKDRQTQFRILFRWITDNMEYDKGNRIDDPEKVIRKMEGMCGAYSKLLSQACAHLGIHCVTIEGIAKGHTTVGSVSEGSAHRHAWNAVEIDGEWHLVDPCWASGYWDDKEKEFTKVFKPEHFYSDPFIFAERHLPDDKKWQLLDHPRNKRDFFSTPLYHAIKYDCGIEMVNEKNAVIKVKEDEDIIIKYSSACQDEDDPSGALDDPRKKYEYQQQFKAQRYMDNPYLTVMFNGEPLVSYKVEVKPVADK